MSKQSIGNIRQYSYYQQPETFGRKNIPWGRMPQVVTLQYIHPPTVATPQANCTHATAPHWVTLATEGTLLQTKQFGQHKKAMFSKGLPTLQK
jgi:hypothetical protein